MSLKKPPPFLMKNSWSSHAPAEGGRQILRCGIKTDISATSIFQELFYLEKKAF